MSRGLGPAQLATLAQLAARRWGMSTADLGALLHVEPRRARAIVASLADRGLLVVARDPGGPPMAWLPEHRQEREAYMVWSDWASRQDGYCPGCGGRVMTTASGRVFRERAIEPTSVIGKAWRQANGA
jgi:hypothetical protein